MRQIKFFQAIHESLDQSLAKDPSVYVMGLGVPDPKGIFGTTSGLQEKYGAERVMDMPTSENGMTGIAAGSAMMGMRPVMVFQRVDFALLALDQIVNTAAKWHYMYGGKKTMPMVMRMIVGRGWGQGAQHSQSLQAWFAHVPGLKVVMPATPYDAKGLLNAAIQDNNPVVFIEHRWLHNTFGNVPEDFYTVPIGEAHVIREGKDITIVALSHMVIESLHAAKILEEVGVDVEVVDIRSLRPLDTETIVRSAAKTGRLIVADTAWKFGGFAGEIVATVAEQAWGKLKLPPRRIALEDCPVPTSQALSIHCYPGTMDIVHQVCEMLGVSKDKVKLPKELETVPADVPDASFSGPF